MEKYIKNNSKQKQFFMKNNSKGITLIALVITIIILLILAGISISVLTGSGLFEKAKIAKNRTEEAQELENQMLQEYENQINQLGEDNQLGGSDIKDTNPEGAMPNGARFIETDATKGIVIEDSKNNQWTWVEVPKNQVFKTATASNQYEAIKTDLINYAIEYRESEYEDNREEYEEMYQKMLSSIYTYGGFWISTYEMGIKGSDEDISLGRTKTSEAIGELSPEAVSQQDHIPYTWIIFGEAQKLASEMTTDSTKTSSLLFGIQWDLVCKYLEVKGDWDTTIHPASYYIKEDSTSWGLGNNSSVKITSNNAKKCDYTNDWIEIVGNEEIDLNTCFSTGASNETNKMNIYDFAGNVYEYTMERKNTTTVVFRGGNQNRNWYSALASYRNIGSQRLDNRGARATLF